MFDHSTNDQLTSQMLALVTAAVALGEISPAHRPQFGLLNSNPPPTTNLRHQKRGGYYHQVFFSSDACAGGTNQNEFVFPLNSCITNIYQQYTTAGDYMMLTGTANNGVMATMNGFSDSMCTMQVSSLNFTSPTNCISSQGGSSYSITFEDQRPEHYVGWSQRYYVDSMCQGANYELINPDRTCLHGGGNVGTFNSVYVDCQDNWAYGYTSSGDCSGESHETWTAEQAAFACMQTATGLNGSPYYSMAHCGGKLGWASSAN